MGTDDQRNPFPRCCLQPWLYPTVWDLVWLSCDPRAQDRKVSEGTEEMGVMMGSYTQGHHHLQCVSGEGLLGRLFQTQKGTEDTQNMAEKPLFSHGERIK